jgi:hypothetical protein
MDVHGPLRPEAAGSVSPSAPPCMAGAVQRTCSASAGAAGTARCRFAAVADAGACDHTLSQPHDFIRMTVHSQGPSVKGEKAIPEKSPAERPGGGACLPPFPPPSEAPALAPPASDGSPAASPPAAHRPDQGQCVLCGPTADRPPRPGPVRRGVGEIIDNFGALKKPSQKKLPAERRAGGACLPPFPPPSEAAPAPPGPPPPAAHRSDQS